MRPFLNKLGDAARSAGAFESVTVEDNRVRCLAMGAAAPAEYRIDITGDGLWVSLSTEDRWLSGSIEAELMNSGDDLNELIEEELVDQGCESPSVAFEHFRDEEQRYTFRSKLGVEPGGDEDALARECLRWLLGYEAAFRDLGDMTEPEDD